MSVSGSSGGRTPLPFRGALLRDAFFVCPTDGTARKRLWLYLREEWRHYWRVGGLEGERERRRQGGEVDSKRTDRYTRTNQPRGVGRLRLHIFETAYPYYLPILSTSHTYKLTLAMAGRSTVNLSTLGSLSTPRADEQDPLHTMARPTANMWTPLCTSRLDTMYLSSASASASHSAPAYCTTCSHLHRRSFHTQVEKAGGDLSLCSHLFLDLT